MTFLYDKCFNRFADVVPVKYKCIRYNLIYMFYKNCSRNGEIRDVLTNPIPLWVNIIQSVIAFTKKKIIGNHCPAPLMHDTLKKKKLLRMIRGIIVTFRFLLQGFTDHQMHTCGRRIQCAAGTFKAVFSESWQNVIWEMINMIAVLPLLKWHIVLLVYIWAQFQFPIRCLIVRSRKDSNPRDLNLELSDRSDIWQAHRQPR